MLRPGGRFAYTVWHGPTSGGTLVGILLKTFQRLGTMEVGLPPAPPMFQFAKSETRDRVLAAAGFTAIAGRDLDIHWRATAPEEIARLLQEGTLTDTARNVILAIRAKLAMQGFEDQGS